MARFANGERFSDGPVTASVLSQIPKCLENWELIPLQYRLDQCAALSVILGERQMQQHRSILLIVAAATLLMMSTTPALALRGKLHTAAGIAFSSSYPEHAQKQVQTALQTDGCKFIDGSFINAVSTLNFGGDTPSLNRLLGELAECPGTTVAVSFKKIEHECDWRLVHDAHANRFDITVNLNSRQVNIEELVIPSAQGPDLKR